MCSPDCTGWIDEIIHDGDRTRHTGIVIACPDCNPGGNPTTTTLCWRCCGTGKSRSGHHRCSYCRGTGKDSL